MTVTTPADAVTITDWTTDDGTPFRTFTGSSWRVPVAGGPEFITTHRTFDIQVEIRGVQFADGHTDRWVAVGAAPEDLPVTTARMLAESIAAALAEIARYSS